MDMKFGIWNVRNLHRAGSLMIVASEISNESYIYWEYRRPDGTGVILNQQANIYFCGKGNGNHELGKYNNLRCQSRNSMIGIN
jgi:hypothetical protein